MSSLCFPISKRPDTEWHFPCLVIKAGCNYVLNECSTRNEFRLIKGDIWQTIVKTIKVVAVNKLVVNKAVASKAANKEAARVTKAADKVAKKAAAVAASKAATAEPTSE